MPQCIEVVDKVASFCELEDSIHKMSGRHGL